MVQGGIQQVGRVHPAGKGDGHPGIFLSLIHILYLTEFFAGMSVMAVELGASRLMAPYFSSSQIVWTVIIGVIMICLLYTSRCV